MKTYAGMEVQLHAFSPRH